ncbi:MAG TPA: LCP family protein [Acidimicrobiia bacterium]|nr:LCP family protein [Acidimicrobiia bacterium]
MTSSPPLPTPRLGRLHGGLALAVAVLLTVSTWAAATWDGDHPQVVVGIPEGTSTSTTGPSIPPSTAAPRPNLPQVKSSGALVSLAQPSGQPWPAAIAFRSSIAVPDDLVFVLVIGSDARPGEDPTRARADSIHLLAANPHSGVGAIVGFPRDSWVDVPGRGHHKLTESLALGGPDLTAQTIRQLTGLPVHYYVVTGFAGFMNLVDEVGGVHVPVPYRMNDPASGARFEAGWHHLGGGTALALARNRKDAPHGDFSRSANQGLLILSALAQMRAEVGDDAGIHRWLGVLLRHVHLDVPMSELPPLAALGRRLNPETLPNVVVPGRAGRAGGASVVHLDAAAAAALFDDVRADGTIGAAPPPTTSTTSTTRPANPSSSTTTTTSSDPGGLLGS